MRLLLARHGETAWNLENRWQGHTDIPLSDSGRKQAAALGARLRGWGIGHVRSSDLERARQTAEIVASELGIAEVGIDPRLRERSFGVFEGLTAEECAARFPEVWTRYQDDRRVGPPGAEPQEAVVARLTLAVQAAVALATSGESVLLVGHGGSIRALLQASFGRPFPPIGNAGLLQIEVHDGKLATVADLGS
jgi:broad specificity phosphatase PhoE